MPMLRTAYPTTSPSVPTPKEIRDQIGDRYCLLPVGHFECPWHRRHLTRAEIIEHHEKTGEKLWLPCERHESWWPLTVREGALTDLPMSDLPDGQCVVFVPAVKRFGAVLPHEWTRVKQTARKARPQIIRHLYQTSLERYRRWRVAGMDTMNTLRDQRRAIEGGASGNDERFPLPQGDRELGAWIFQHANSLWCSENASNETRDKCVRAIENCRPFQMAIGTVVAVTGYTEKAVESAAHRTGMGHVRDPQTGLHLNLKTAPK